MTRRTRPTRQRVEGRRAESLRARRAGAVLGALLVLGTLLTPAALATRSEPPFAYRGIIEGFYGTPYSHADRMDLVGWEAAHGMNIFVNAPKEDPYVRSLWRHQYPPAELAEMIGEVRLAARLGISWVPDIGPGIPEIPSPNVAVPDRDICFSCPADLASLVSKYRPFVDAGAKTIMVSFDDTVKASSWPQDNAAYGTGDAAYGRMDADLLNRLADAFPAVTVLTVPADYSGTSSTAYLASFAAHLDRSIVVMWTGVQTVARQLNGSDAAAFDRVVGRRVVVWDNYPVNDYAGGIVDHPTNLFLGPVTGRGPDLVGQIGGILANPMGEWQASKIALATLADDLANPWTYNPETSWQRSLDSFAGGSAPEVAELADNCRSSTLGQAESIVFEPDATAFLRYYKSPAWPPAASTLATELEREQVATSRLYAAHFNPEFMTEAAPFLARLQTGAGAGLEALDLLEAQRPSISAHLDNGPGRSEILSGSASPPSAPTVAADAARLAALMPSYAGDYHNVYGDRFAVDVDGNVYAAANLMDQFLQTASTLSASWLPTAPMASSSVQVTVNGRAVSNPFHVVLPADSAAVVLATDGAGGQTEQTFG